jgi:thioredoxin 1
MKGNFDSIINSQELVLVDFHAIWCGPCKMQAPILQEFANEIDGKVRVIKIDIDKNPSIAQRFKVKSVPTLMLFKNGEILWQEAGMKSKQQLLDATAAAG